MSVPVVGLTTYRHLNKQGAPLLSVNEAYVRAVSNAGGCPLLIPLGLSSDALQSLAKRLDGVLFTGGGDVHPERYNSSPHSLVNEVDEDRDQLELDLFNIIAEKHTPFLGICRGLQVINVARGGTLYEDILDQRAGSLQHQHSKVHPRNYLAHPVQLEPDSRLHAILGSERVEVNSLHHQGIRRLAPELRATAYAPDGIIEAVELPDYPFGLAVQWHPEWLQEHEPMRRLFGEFIQAAGRKE